MIAIKDEFRNSTYSEAMLISGASKQISCAIFIFYSIFKSTVDTVNRLGYIVRIITPYCSFMINCQIMWYHVVQTVA